MPDSVATLLKETREGHERSLRDVATALNIRYVYLQAIEDGEFNKLPGNTYAIGFLRSYGEFLGLDSDDLVTRFKAEVAGLDKKTRLVFPTPVPEGKVPGGALILVSVLFFGLAYGAWSFFSKQDSQVADLVPAVPERLQDLLVGDQAEVGVAPAESAPVESAPGAEDGSAVAELPRSTAEPVPDAEAASVAPEELAPDEPAPDEPARNEAIPRETEQAEVTPLETTPFETAPIESAPIESAPIESAPIESAAEPADADAPEPSPASGATVPAEPAPTAETTGASVSSSDTLAAAPAPEAAAGLRTAPSPEAPATTITAAPEPQAIPAAPSTGETAVTAGPLVAQVFGRGNVGTRIVLRATQDSWVQVRDGNEDLLFTRVLRAGDSYRVPNQSGLTLLTGNAGGLEVEVDGSPLGPLGPVGTVRRNVALEPTGLLDGSILAQ
jgi:cytoskeletal protein RodZ